MTSAARPAAPGAGERSGASGLRAWPGVARAAARRAARRRGTGRADPAAWLIAAAVFAAYTAISLDRYVRLDPGSWDLGIYTEYVKALAHLRAPIVPIRGPGFNLLGDHFQVIVGLLAPLFRVFPSPVTLLVAQAALTAISVLPVCRAARELLGTGVSRTIGAAYGFSWGLQQMVNFDFHEVAFAVPLLAFSLSALVRARPRAAAAWALPLVLVKEDQGFTVAAIGLVMLGSAVRAWAGGGAAAAGWPGRAAAGPGGACPGAAAGAGAGPRAWAQAGALLAVWGLGWSWLEIAVIIPHFNPAHHYEYWKNGGALSPGAHLPLSAVAHQVAVAGTRKLRTAALILTPTAFLALASPLALAALPGLALRFVSTNSYFWGDGYHYNATVMPIVFLAAVDALARWQARSARGEAGSAGASRPGAGRPGAEPPLPGRVRRPGASIAAAVPALAAAAMAAIAAALAFPFPLSSLWQPGAFAATAHLRAERAAMSRVPPGTSVESTLPTLAPLAARDQAYWVGTAGRARPRYVVFDAADSGYAHVPADVPAFVSQINAGARYRVIFRADDVYVLRRSARTPR